MKTFRVEVSGELGGIDSKFLPSVYDLNLVPKNYYRWNGDCRLATILKEKNPLQKDIMLEKLYQFNKHIK